MKKVILSALCLSLVAANCNVTPKPVPNPVKNTGGSAATGGSTSNDIISTGGSTVNGTGGASVIFPSCTPQGMKVSPPEHRILNWKSNAKRKHGMMLSVPYTPISSMWTYNDSICPDQNGYGACAGFAGMNSISFFPFLNHATNQLGYNVYSGATKIDNGCAWNATTCAGSFPPNDTGTYGSSALKVLIGMKLLKSYTSLYTFSDMMKWVNTIGSCVIGTKWYPSMMNTINCGHLIVDTSIPTNDGHARAIVGIDIIKKVIWESNSWGQSWGACIGPRCGFHSITIQDEETLFNDGGEIDCPNN